MAASKKRSSVPLTLTIAAIIGSRVATNTAVSVPGTPSRWLVMPTSTSPKNDSGTKPIVASNGFRFGQGKCGHGVTIHLSIERCIAK